jgi:hypothetical protein
MIFAFHSARVYLASWPQVEGISGKYFANRRAIRSPTNSYGKGAAKRLWRASAEMTGL